ncbi:two-component sensor histidine kinase [Malaciobacter mytili]|uniref:sensor histidine kinase n=1 Tax=Malaciobacter mytili TaxID=603050 RepID=UPI00100C2929|nr:HAMP domain-containing sensor histidine kinase [Malaciobacter mytili]RXI42656.1 two-component sensor histidine kinase [Malaciobacter mytili]
MILIALLYYENEKKLYFDYTKTKVQNFASLISSKIILTHMNAEKKDTKGMLFEDKYSFSLYNQKKEKIYGNINEEIDFSKKLIEKDTYFILLDNSTYNHLGVAYIAIKDNSFYLAMKDLKRNIILLFLVIYFIISLIGFFLAKLFLKPIKDEREKLNTFIKDTTHELNTPISAILMSAENEDLTKKQIQRIKLAALKISEIYKDLTYVFLEENTQKTNIVKLNLEKIINEQLKYFEALAEKKSIQITYELEETFYEIDENDFIRLFNNILSNAIKYNKKRGTIHISLKDFTLNIQDNGIGISQEKIKDIFNRYYRATTQSGGFGIGLNIVQNICFKYNIKVNVKSQLNKGTTFSFNF